MTNVGGMKNTSWSKISTVFRLDRNFSSNERYIYLILLMSHILWNNFFTYYFTLAVILLSYIAFSSLWPTWAVKSDYTMAGFVTSRKIRYIFSCGYIFKSPNSHVGSWTRENQRQKLCFFFPTFPPWVITYIGVKNGHGTQLFLVGWGLLLLLILHKSKFHLRKLAKNTRLQGDNLQSRISLNAFFQVTINPCITYVSLIDILAQHTPLFIAPKTYPSQQN